MNEREIIGWLRQAQSHALMAYRKNGRAETWGESEAYRKAADYIEATLSARRAEMIEAIDRKQTKAGY